MKKRRDFKSELLMFILVMVVFHTFMHLTVIDNVNESRTSSLSGLAVGEEKVGENSDAGDLWKSLSRVSVVFEWFIAAFFVLFIHFSKKSTVNDEYSKVKTMVEARINIMETDLDKLYEVLKVVKVIRLSTIVKVFNVSKDVAMDWCKTLEVGSFASIEYPRFGEPELVLEEGYQEV